ncbi:beta-galactosidase [Cohnella sp. WQ 127256]|uniref:beta-galactosidase n=1 Tax=Cohnella sp. WQ 127256 TaxID=2938790 RepID=UPI0021182035|nr:beta-galactosidase [Cohnella sp. WQ 127256]
MTLSRYRLGSSYYPERWQEERWAIDAKLMKDIGFNIIRMGEFAWSKLEPAPGNFDFAWLDKAITVFAEQDVQTILCTPTASPMPWISAMFPDMSPTTEDGNFCGPGQRRHYCYNHEGFLALSDRIVMHMAEHYAGHPNIIGWQIDNELGGEEFICYCHKCRLAFQSWLKGKYGTIGELNHRWGGTFFSFEFRDWSEIPVPRGHQTRYFNPSFRQDYLRFASDSMMHYLYHNNAILKKHFPHLPITTNRYTLFWSDKWTNKFDHAMDQALDVIAFDNYDLNPAVSAFHHEFYRSIKKNRPYWVLEQNASTIAFGTRQSDIKWQTVEAFARGAELVCLFSWRQIHYGVEQDLNGIVDHNGNPGEAYESFREVSKWMMENEKFLSNCKPRVEVAILYSYESSLVYEVNPLYNRIDYNRELQDQVHRAFLERGIGVDFVRTRDDWRVYKMIVVPLCITGDEVIIDKLEQFARQGGLVVLSGDFLQKTIDHWRSEGTRIASIEELTGLRHDKMEFLLQEGLAAEFLSSVSGRNYPLRGFFNKFSIIPDRDVRIIGTVTKPDSEAEVPAAVVRKVGEGEVYTLASMLDRNYLQELIAKHASELGWEQVILPERTGLVTLENNEGKRQGYLLINQREESISIMLPGCAELVHIEAGGFELIKEIV